MMYRRMEYKLILTDIFPCREAQLWPSMKYAALPIGHLWNLTRKVRYQELLPMGLIICQDLLFNVNIIHFKYWIVHLETVDLLKKKKKEHQNCSVKQNVSNRPCFLTK